jgi:anti-sigma B factor antagonist
MAPKTSFHFEIEKSPADAQGNKVTTVKCHGSLIAENTREIKEAVKPLLPLGGRIVIDLTDVDYLDSSGLGALVGLKVSALHQGLVILQFVNMGPRILELLRIAGLEKIISS